MKNLTTGLIAVTLIILVGLACSKSDTTKPSDSSPTPKSTESSSSDNKTGSTPSPLSSSSPGTSTDTTKTSGGDIAGNYSVTGKNANGQAYAGDLAIKKQDAVYQFTWTTAGHSYDGVAVQGGNLVAAGFTNGTDGKGCGAAVYKIGDTSLTGELASWGYNSTSTQTATLISKTKTSGKFNLEGTDTDGTPYKGTLDIQQSGDVYQLNYGGTFAFHGTGFQQGDYLAAGVGKSTCGFAVYEIKDGTLAGIWGGIGTSKVGTEVATRK